MSPEWISTILASLALLLSTCSLYISARQNNLYAGASAAIAWRQQVLDLYDRGLEPGQIREIMLLEEGGEGYEAGNGKIDEILRHVPRQPRQ